MSVKIKCNKCGILGLFSGFKDYKSVSKIVNKHKDINGKKHRIWVKRVE